MLRSKKFKLEILEKKFVVFKKSIFYNKLKIVKIAIVLKIRNYKRIKTLLDTYSIEIAKIVSVLPFSKKT